MSDVKTETGPSKRLLALLREPTKEMLDAGMTAAQDCLDSDWDSGCDGESYNHYEYLRSDASAVIFKAMVDVALKQLSESDRPNPVTIVEE